jgi:hypothetical protein
LAGPGWTCPSCAHPTANCHATTLPSGEEIAARGLTFHRLADGRIVEDDAITTPDLMQLFTAQMPPPAS